MNDDETGAIRPNLILLNEWLHELHQRGIAANEYCDDDWAKLVLMDAGVSEVDAISFVEECWW